MRTCYSEGVRLQRAYAAVERMSQFVFALMEACRPHEFSCPTAMSETSEAFPTYMCLLCPGDYRRAPSTSSDAPSSLHFAGAAQALPAIASYRDPRLERTTAGGFGRWRKRATDSVSPTISRAGLSLPGPPTTLPKEKGRRRRQDGANAASSE